LAHNDQAVELGEHLPHKVQLWTTDTNKQGAPDQQRAEQEHLETMWGSPLNNNTILDISLKPAQS
jgi:hypothetical protein